MENENEDSNTSYDKISLPVKKKRNLFWLWIVITAIVAGGGVGALLRACFAECLGLPAAQSG